MPSINCLNWNFCNLKLCIKYKLIDHIVNKYPIDTKLNMCINSVKNI